MTMFSAEALEEFKNVLMNPKASPYKEVKVTTEAEEGQPSRQQELASGQATLLLQPNDWRDFLAQSELDPKDFKMKVTHGEAFVPIPTAAPAKDAKKK